MILYVVDIAKLCSLGSNNGKPSSGPDNLLQYGIKDRHLDTLIHTAA